MLNRKSQSFRFPAAVAVALIGSLGLVATVLVEAVVGMQSYL
jgi:hypothetical protein